MWNMVVGAVLFASIGLQLCARIGAKMGSHAIAAAPMCLVALMGCFSFGWWIYGWVVLYG